MASAQLQVTMASAPVQDHTLRLILIGKTGTGKSATGNTILDEKTCCATSIQSNAFKKCVEGKTTRFDNAMIHIIDTPGMRKTGFCEKEVDKEEIGRSIEMANPGPHAFLLILRIGRITVEDIDTIETFRQLFGENIFKYTVVVFTGGDELQYDGLSFKEYIATAPPQLKHVVELCGGRLVCVNNRGTEAEKKEICESLLELVKSISFENKAPIYTMEMYQKAIKIRPDALMEENARMEAKLMSREAVQRRIEELEEERKAYQLHVRQGVEGHNVLQIPLQLITHVLAFLYEWFLSKNPVTGQS